MIDIASAFTGTYGTLYYVSDMAKAAAYYKEVFGLTPKMESPQWTEFDFNGHALCLHATDLGKVVDGKGILITKVKGLDQVYETLKARGVEFVGAPHPVCEGGWSADFRDPSGNLISLFEYKG